MKKYFLFISVAVIGCSPPLSEVSTFPVVKTIDVSNIDESGAQLNAQLLGSGGVEITSYGFVWDLDNPTLNTSNFEIAGTDPGVEEFSMRINRSLNKDVSYLVRSFVIFNNDSIENVVYGNAVGFTSLGSDESFWTLEKENVLLQSSGNITSTAIGATGYILFPNGTFYEFDSESSSFDSGPLLDVEGNDRQPKALVDYNNQLLVFNNAQNEILRLSDDSWVVEYTAEISDLFKIWPHTTENGILLFTNTQSYRFDPSNSNFTEISPIPAGNRSVVGIFATTSTGDAEFVITWMGTLFEYNEDQDTWIERSTLDRPLTSGNFMFHYENKLYTGLTKNELVWAFDLATNTWEQVGKIQASTFGKDVFSFYIDEILYLGLGENSNFSAWSFTP